jgi:hypothetical protein
MTQRVMTNNFVCMVEQYSLMPTGWIKWYDISVGGLATADAILADLRANAAKSYTYAISKYHYYFEDGGHARTTSRYDMTQAYALYGAAQPDKAPSPLVPTPEYWIQEGITG